MRESLVEDGELGPWDLWPVGLTIIPLKKGCGEMNTIFLTKPTALFLNSLKKYISCLGCRITQSLLIIITHDSSTLLQWMLLVSTQISPSGQCTSHPHVSIIGDNNTENCPGPNWSILPEMLHLSPPSPTTLLAWNTKGRSPCLNVRLALSVICTLEYHVGSN